MLFQTVKTMNISAAEQSTYFLLIDFTLKFCFLYI